MECRRVTMNVLFPGIPPSWEGSKEGKVGDGYCVAAGVRGGRERNRQLSI